MENYEICHCMKVSYSDIEDTMHKMKKLDDVFDTFRAVQEATSCSKGCGRCYDEVVDTISKIMNG
ncbi:MAG: (2Fe-2S)-binding protein [Ruminococcus sp.]|nr:(2Fe-2S)-binding protein [Ruminococcus sp.]